MAMPSFYKKPRISLATRLEATFSKKSVRQVYETRKVQPLVPGSKGLAYDTPMLQVKDIRGGWSKVTYRDPAAMNPVTFHIRTKELKPILEEGGDFWRTTEEYVYSHWINTTKAGGLYTKRRKVEGMLKASIKKKDWEMVEKLQQILQMSDEKVAEFWDAWRAAHSDAEIEDFFNYEDEVDESWQ